MGENVFFFSGYLSDIMHRVLTRRKESRKRNLCFHLPVAVPLNPTLRLLANDPSYVTLQHIYDEHCDSIQIAREDPQLAFAEKFESVYSSSVCLFRSPTSPTD